MINRIILIIIDSLGIGALPDAKAYNDSGANTLKHILDKMGSSYSLPNLEKFGLLNLLDSPSKNSTKPSASYARLACKSPAKDSTVGHWELTGLVVDKALPTYPDGFPKKLIEDFEKRIGTKTLGNCAASGTEIIQRLGQKHLETGCPIIYTSADSVFQIQTHEEKTGLERLYEMCRTARDMLTGKHAVGRVIARPFTGVPGSFTRTENRRDFSLSPFKPTLLDIIKKSGNEVIAIGKIGDLFNHQGITREIHTADNREGMAVSLNEVKAGKKSAFSLIFTNLVDFDMKWGHRRDVKAYADGLKEFDNFLPELAGCLNDSDVLMITADHGCDPAYIKHTDHTREYVPFLVYGKEIKAGVNLGTRETFADVGQTISDIFSLQKLEFGTTFLNEIKV